MTTENTSNLPTHSVYQVIEAEGKKPFWMKIGACWSHADGRGFNVQLDAVPLAGRIVIREPNARGEEQENTEAQQ